MLKIKVLLLKIASASIKGKIIGGVATALVIGGATTGIIAYNINSNQASSNTKEPISVEEATTTPVTSEDFEMQKAMEESETKKTEEQTKTQEENKDKQQVQDSKSSDDTNKESVNGQPSDNESGENSQKGESTPEKDNPPTQNQPISKPEPQHQPKPEPQHQPTPTPQPTVKAAGIDWSLTEQVNSAVYQYQSLFDDNDRACYEGLKSIARNGAVPSGFYKVYTHNNCSLNVTGYDTKTSSRKYDPSSDIMVYTYGFGHTPHARTYNYYIVSHDGNGNTITKLYNLKLTTV